MMEPDLQQQSYSLHAPAPKIYNMVSMMHLNISQNLRLREIAAKANGSTYNPRRFGALIMRVLKPKATALIFRNGKIVITGTKSEIEAVLVGRKIVKKLKNFVGNEQVSWDERVQVCNVVGCVGTKLKINLEKMLDQNSNTQYDPNCFPGLIYRMKNPKLTFLVFTTGKVIITGGKSQQGVYESFQQFYRILFRYRKLKHNQRSS